MNKWINGMSLSGDKAELKTRRSTTRAIVIVVFNCCNNNLNVTTNRKPS
jgi:hypothetical protein